MTEPLVSVIIPVYNASVFIHDAVESIFAQTYRHVEVIAVDDGSTDNTPEVLHAFGNRIKYFRQKNRGPAAARNKALGSAQGKYLAFLDADDLLLPTKLAKQVEILEKSPVLGWTYCDIEYIDHQGKRLYLASEYFSYSKRERLNGLLFSALIQGNFIPIHAPLIRRDCIDSASPFDEDEKLIGVEDWGLLIYIARSQRAQYCPEVLATCLVHPGSLSSDPIAREFRRFYLLDKTVRMYPQEMGVLGVKGRKLIADTHNWFAYRHMEAGHWKEAIQRLRSSLMSYPIQRRAFLALLHAVIQRGRVEHEL